MTKNIKTKHKDNIACSAITGIKRAIECTPPTLGKQFAFSNINASSVCELALRYQCLVVADSALPRPLPFPAPSSALIIVSHF